jgi:endogenous inhibitor of DNA gyrase (YacG/DUF329 family)
MSTLRCPTCSQQFDPQLSVARPFCSDRCRQIDLRRWLNEEISIPGEDEGGEEPDERFDDSEE